MNFLHSESLLSVYIVNKSSENVFRNLFFQAVAVVLKAWSLEQVGSETISAQKFLHIQIFVNCSGIYNQNTLIKRYLWRFSFFFTFIVVGSCVQDNSKQRLQCQQGIKY